MPRSNGAAEWRGERGVVALIVLLAFGLRVFRLGTQSLWGDETISVFRAFGSLAEITEKVRHEGTLPPLYYYLLHFWIPGAGSGETSVRFASVIFGVLAIPLIYALVSATLGRRIATIAAFIAALSPFWVYYAQETRTYSLVTALVILAVYLLVRSGTDERTEGPAKSTTAGKLESVDQSPSFSAATTGSQSSFPWLWVAYAVVAALALASFYFSGFALFATTVWRLSDRRHWPGTALRCILAQVGALVLLAPLLIYVAPSLVEQAGSVSRAGVPLSTVLRQLAYTVNFGASANPGQVKPLVALALILAALGLISVPWRQSLLWGALLVIPVLAIFEVSFVPHPGWERYFITASPAWYALVAAGLSVLAFGLPREATIRAFWPRSSRPRSPREARKLRRRGARETAGMPARIHLPGIGILRLAGLAVAGAASVALMTGIASSLHNYYFDPAYWRNDLRGAEKPVEALVTPDVAVIVNGPPQFPSFFYYFHKTIPWFELPAPNASGEQTLSKLGELTKRYRGLWFVKYHPPDYDPDNYVEVWLDQHAYLVSLRWVENMTYSLYTTDDPAAPRIVASGPIGQKFGTAAELVSYRTSLVRAQGAAYLLVTLSWRALETPSQSVKIFAHLVDQNGTLVTQSDHFPEADLRPASTWRPGEIMDDRFALRLPDDYTRRGLRLTVGLYHPDGSRLPVPGSADNSLTLPLPGLNPENVAR